MKKSKNRKIQLLKILFIIISLFTLRMLYPTNTPSIEKHGELTFESQNININIEVADEPDERSLGLMNRKQLGKMDGMLFIFEESKIRSFWMKNTYIPLDIIFVDENLKIINIAKNTTPLFEGTYSSENPAKYVIEVNAGFTDNNNIEPGNQISYNLNII